MSWLGSICRSAASSSPRPARPSTRRWRSSHAPGAGRLATLRRIVLPLLVPGIVSGWILMATMFVRELSLSVVPSRPRTEVLAVQILRFSEDGLWGRLAALGIVMILISTSLVVIAGLVGRQRMRAFGLEGA